MKVLLTLSYDGTNYGGWQIQPNRMTIQEKLQKALSVVYGRPIAVLGSSRTDAGVHAVSQHAVYTIEDEWEKIPFARLPYVINRNLPDDIVVTKGEKVSLDFHPIACIDKKTYQYTLDNSPFPNPIYRNTSWHFRDALDVSAMKNASQYLLGTHDFIGFSSSGRTTKTTVRTLYTIDIAETDSIITFSLCGNGFLYNMVRIIVGTLVDVGLGKKTSEDITRVLESGNRSLGGRTAPAHGLILFQTTFRIKN